MENAIKATKGTKLSLRHKVLASRKIGLLCWHWVAVSSWELRSYSQGYSQGWGEASCWEKACKGLVLWSPAGKRISSSQPEHLIHWKLLRKRSSKWGTDIEYKLQFVLCFALLHRSKNKHRQWGGTLTHSHILMKNRPAQYWLKENIKKLVISHVFLTMSKYGSSHGVKRFLINVHSRN